LLYLHYAAEKEDSKRYVTSPPFLYHVLTGNIDGSALHRLGMRPLDSMFHQACVQCRFK
jgi:hypothetical protein